MTYNSASAAHSDPARKAELAVIHTARRSLALSEDSYRAIVSRFSNGRTDSSGALSAAERRKVIEYFRSIGFKPTARTPGGASRGANAVRADHRPQAMKLSALWYALYQLGVVREYGADACAAFVCRHTGITAMRWNDADDLRMAIECLKAWCERVGYTPKPFRSTSQSPLEGSFKPGLIQAQWNQLDALGAFRFGGHAGLDTFLRNLGYPVAAPQFLDDDGADAAIRRLGSWIRRLAKPEDSAEGAPDG